MIGSARDDKQFRRGVVLGLTMAEALLLLIFLLMLILGVRLKNQSTHIAALEKARDEAQSTLVAMQPYMSRLSKSQQFDINQDYVRVQQQLADANARLKDAGLTVDLVQQAASLAPPDATPEEATRALLNEASIGRQALEAAQRFAPDLSPEQAVAALLNAATVGQSLKDGGTPDPRGKLVFEGACVSCHGWTGESSISPLATLTGAWAVNDPAATNVAQIVITGTMRRGALSMPAFGNAYSDVEIAAVANYVTARFGSKGSHLTAQDVAELRKQTSE